MDCDAAKLLIQARHDRDLDVERAIELGGHLALCAECRELSADLEQLCTATAALPEFATRGALTARAMARAVPVKLEPRTSPWRIALYMGAAVCIALMIGQGLTWSGLLQPGAEVVRENPIAPPIPPAPHTPPTSPIQVNEKGHAVQNTKFIANAAPIEMQSGQDALKALVAQHYLSEQRRPEADRQRERRHAELLSYLHSPTKAKDAVATLLEEENNSADVWPVAAAISDPNTGEMVFAAAAKLKPELRFVPIYIAALDSAATRTQANEILRGISGKKHLGPQKEAWLAWWSQARSQLRDD